MGYTRHHAIVVTTYTEEYAKAAHDWAYVTFRNVSPIMESPVNGYYTFLIPPDGSKEGWDESERGDVLRATYVRWLRSRAFADGSNPYRWAEVQYGDDEDEAKIVSSGDDTAKEYRVRYPDYNERTEHPADFQDFVNARKG